MSRAVIFSVAALFGVLALAAAAGVRVNLSPSLPVGLWLTMPVTDRIGKGDIVQFCPPLPEAPCSHASPMFLKPVIATAGDLVIASAAGVAVNGRLIGHSAPVSDGSPASIPPGAYLLARDELWVLSTRHPRSFDSRYFGAIKRTTLRAKARPLLVWE